jgi:hypothetical protein
LGFEAYVRLSLGVDGGDQMRRCDFMTLVGGAAAALLSVMVREALLGRADKIIE